jgi:hypothetical protein
MSNFTQLPMSYLASQFRAEHMLVLNLIDHQVLPF